MSTYQYRAVQTLNRAYFKNENVSLHLIENNLNKIEQAGSLLDQVKKVIFYGKFDSFFKDEVLPAYRAKCTDSKNQIVFHMLLGILTECAELVPVIKNIIRDENFNINDEEFQNYLIKEFGDFRWYISVCLHTLGVTDAQCENLNIRKLEARFGKSFDAEKALTRNLKNEDSLKFQKKSEEFYV
jgi:hypothetical protein